MSAPVVVTGWGVQLDVAGAPALLGRKGLLYKEPATRLALCAVHRALGLPDGVRPGTDLDPDTAVVASSNLGNIATVAGVTRTVAHEGGRAVSPMAAPNASSNVVAGTVALWFRFGGPNLMLCNGETSGLDAVAAGALLIRAGRAGRVVVVGTEPADADAAAIYPAIRAGAACVVLEPAGNGGGPLLTTAVDADATGTAVTRDWAGHYGARGVLQVAEAVRRVAGGAPSVDVRCGTARARVTRVAP